jgi:hypothetical protein
VTDGIFSEFETPRDGDKRDVSCTRKRSPLRGTVETSRLSPPAPHFFVLETPNECPQCVAEGIAASCHSLRIFGVIQMTFAPQL